MTVINVTLRDNVVSEQRSAINELREQLEESPVSVTIARGTYIVDANETSIRRMLNGVDAWNASSRSQIDWTMVDNSVVSLNRNEFIALKTESQRIKAERALRLHDHAQALKALIPNLPADWDSIDSWPT